MSLPHLSRPWGSGPVPKPMNRESQARFVAVLLFLLTVAAVVFAGFNFEKERESAVPDDGVWWIEHGGRLVADRIDPNGPGAKAGIKAGRPAGLHQRPGNQEHSRSGAPDVPNWRLVEGRLLAESGSRSRSIPASSWFPPIVRSTTRCG